MHQLGIELMVLSLDAQMDDLMIESNVMRVDENITLYK